MSRPTPEPSRTEAIAPSAAPGDRAEAPPDQTLLQPSSTPPPDQTLAQPADNGSVDHTILQPATSAATARIAAEPSDDQGGTIAQAAPPAAVLAAVLHAVRIPGYEVLDELGRGGMGVVYKARQVGLNRLVALKMVLSGDYAAAGELARFRLEAESVAKFQHPNIVQIYEINEVKGRPYFCLEFVDGGPLHKKLAGDPQPPRRAAELMRLLAGAMEYAHQRHIIHRDLKPANVLLTADGLPKIADFGLAKKLDDDTARTQSGSILGTPTYMAPEQTRGADVGPAADVYSLGAILYEMLVGRPPFKGATVMDTLEQVRSQEPVPPSRLQPKMPRDLETICLKCLEKNPRNRYTGAGALEEDLRRFLAGEPIKARPTPAWERLWKWTRRHPAPAALAAVAALFALSVAVGGAAFGVYQRWVADEQTRLLHAAEAEHQRAEGNFQKARTAVDEMLTAVGQVRLAHEPHMEQIRRELLGRALHFQEQFLQEKSDDPEVRRETGRAHLRVGDIQRMLGDQAAAEQSYGAARDFFTALRTEHPDDARYRQDLAVCLNNLGQLLQDGGRAPEAEQAFRDALDLRRKLVDESGRDEDRRESAAVANNLGALLLGAGRYAEAESLLREALAGRQALADASTAPDLRLDLARTHDNLGALLAATGRTEEAGLAFGDALKVLKGLADEHPDVPDYRQEWAVTHNHLGNLWRDTDPKKSEQEYAQSLQLRERLVADFPTVPAYREEQAASLHSLAYVRQAAGRRDEADKDYDRATEIEKKLAADYPTVPEYQYDLAAGYTNRGVLLQTNNRLAEAEKLYGLALPLLEKLTAGHSDAPTYQQQLAGVLQNIGVLYQTTNRPLKAEKALARSADLRRDLADRHPKAPVYQQDMAAAQLNLGVLWQMNGKLPEAEACYVQAVDQFTRLADAYPATPDYRHLQADALNDRGNLLRALNRPAEAEKDWRKAVDLLTRLKDEQPAVPIYRQELASSLNELAIFLASADRRPEAEKTWGQVLAIQGQLTADFPKDAVYSEELAKYQGNLGVLYAQGGRLVQAEQSYRKAIAYLEDLDKANPGVVVYAQDLRDPYTNLIHLLTATGAPAEEQEKCWRRLVELDEKLIAAYPGVVGLRGDLRDHLAALGDTLLKGRDPVGAAAVLARCAGLAAADDALPAKKREEAARSYGDRAMDALRKATAEGFKDAGYLKKADFEPLRSRDDFKKLQADLEKK